VKESLRFWLIFAVAGLAAPNALHAAAARSWVVKSPTHGQTFSFGSERHQQWMTRGRDRHLALSAEFTNDPYVDQIQPRQYDDFVFDFPAITLGNDGRTFYYHAPGGASIPVASRYADFLGIDEIKLLKTSFLVMKSPHGYLSLELLVSNHPLLLRHPVPL
jgi:hypothetical protein